MTPNILRFRQALSCAIVVMVSASTAVAQRASLSTVPSVPASTVLTNFEKMTRSGRPVIPNEVKHPDRYPAARVDSVLGGLERIAQTSSSGFQKSAAVSAIMRVGSGEHPTAGNFDRALRLYRTNSDFVIRSRVLSLMPKQQDRARALAFLKSVTTQSGARRDYEYAPFHAAEALSHMGSDGRAALIELRNKKSIRDPKTMGFVHYFLTT